MRLPARKKQSLYISLSKLLRSGIAFPAALDKLATTTSGGFLKLLLALRASIAGGKTVGEAFSALPRSISAMEAGLITSAERSGRLEHGFNQLATYYETIAGARDLIIRKSLYPLVMFHLGALGFSLGTLFNSGFVPFLREVSPLLGGFYAAVGLLTVAVFFLRDAGSSSPAIDRFLRLVPFTGKVRTSFATARFFMVYGIELDAGLNVIDALIAAGRTSRSGLIRAAVDRAVPEVRNGSQPGPFLAQSRVFPEDAARALVVGEDSGELDAELARIATEYQARAGARLDLAASALTKGFYLGVMLFVGWRILVSYQQSMDQMGKLLDF